MKTKKKNKNRTEKQLTKFLALAIIILFMFSIIPSFVFAAINESTKGGEDMKDPSEKDIAEDMAEEELSEDELQRIKDLNQIKTIDPNVIAERDDKISVLDIVPGKTKAELITKAEDLQKKWNLGSLVPCSGGGGGLDCILDIGTTTISVIWGIGMGYNLARIKGSCSAEESLKGLTAMEQEEACKSCNADPLRLCTLERCMILGNCIPVPPEEGTSEEMSNYICVPGKCEETGVVGIESIDVSFFVEGEEKEATDTNTEKDKFEVSGQVPFNADSTSIEITTDKLAQCRYSFEAQQDYENMIDFDDNYFPGTYDEADPQSAIIMLPGSMPRNHEHTVYIKCKNVCGEVHSQYDDNHYVRFTFEKKPDQLPPIIVAMDPPNMGAVSGNLNTLTVQFNLDENGYCQYSDNYTVNSNQNPVPLTTVWEEMIKFGDLQSIESAVVGGECKLNQECPDLRTDECSHCFLDLNLNKGYTEYDWEQLSPELQEQLGLEDKVKFFHYKIRCADVQENKMPEEDTLDYSFFVVPEYEMEIIKPEDYSSTYNINPDIEVTSSRNTNCRYEVLKQEQCKEVYPEWDEMIEIDGLFDKEHFGEVQEDLIPSIQGTPYCIYVKCRDMWQLERKDKAFFKLFQDVYNPKVIRMYHDIFAGDYLLIETNEDSTCVYGTDDEIRCNYNFDEGNEMTGNNATIHTAYWSLDHLYYIRCQDQWGNIPVKGQCTVIINPFEIPAIPF